MTTQRLTQMSSSTDSGDVVDQGAAGSAESVVECDRGGEGEEACGDAGAEAVQGAGAVAFEAEQVFAGLEDGLDPLPDRGQVGSLAGFVFAAGPADGRVQVGGGVFERGRRSLCRRRRSGARGARCGRAWRGRRRVRMLFGELSWRARGVPSSPNRPCRRNPQKKRLWLAQGRSRPPRPAGSVCSGLDAAAAFERGRVDHDEIVVEPRTVGREDADQRLDRVGQPLAPLEETRTPGQPRKQMRSCFRAALEEPLVRGMAQQRLRHTKRDDLRVGQDPPGVLGRAGRRSSAAQNTVISNRSRSASIAAPLGRRRD